MGGLGSIPRSGVCFSQNLLMHGPVFHKLLFQWSILGIMEEIPEMCHLHWQKSHKTTPLERNVCKFALGKGLLFSMFALLKGMVFNK